MLSFSSVGQSSPDAAQNIQTMRLRDDPPPITQQQRNSKKRKTPPADGQAAQQQQQQQQAAQQQQQAQQQAAQQAQQQQQQQQQQQNAQQQQQNQQAPPQIQHVLPPPHALMHPIPGPLPPGYSYAPTDYTPGGMPPGLPIQQQQQPQQHQSQSPPPSSNARALSSTKRAEQNRKAQRAFRERRDQHVKALEARSQLLDAALASADEANRRWEECRALVDQLRVENTALRAALSQAHLLPPTLSSTTSATHNGTQQPEDPKPSESAVDTKSDAPEKPSDHNLS